MNFKKLASLVARIEGKKSQVKIGDVREVLSVLRRLIKKDPSVLVPLVKK